MNNPPDPPPFPYVRRYPHRPKFFPVVDRLEGQATVHIPALHVNSADRVERPEKYLHDVERQTDSRRGEVPQIELVPTPYAQAQVRPSQNGYAQPTTRKSKWIPGTFGFDSRVDDSFAVKTDTIPMMVLKEISHQRGQDAPVMQSEISGAASGAAIFGVGNLAGNVLKLICNFVIQRGFGPAVYGLYIIGTDTVTLIASIFNLGLDDAMIRYTSIYRGKQQTSSLRTLTIFCTALAGIVGIIGALILLIFAPYVASFRHEPMVADLLLFMAPLVPLLTMQSIWLGGLQGFKAFKWRVLSDRVGPPVALLVLLCLAVIFYRNLSGMTMAILISTLIGTLLSLYFLFRTVSRVSSNSESKHYEIREWLGFAIPNFLTSITDVVLLSVDTLLLVIFSISDAAIGQYGAANKLAMFVVMPLVSLNAMFAPTIAELHSKNEHQKLAAMFKIVTKWIITFSLPIFLIVTIFSRPLLALSGQFFVNAWPLLVAFAFGNMVNAGTGSVGNMLLMTGHQKLMFANSLIAVFINVLVGILLTPRYGAMGTAVSTGLAVMVVNLLGLLQVVWLLKMHPYRWDMLKPVGAALLSALLAGGLLYLANLIHINLLLQLGLIPVFCAGYFGALILFKIGPEDQVVVNALRGKLLRGKK